MRISPHLFLFSSKKIWKCHIFVLSLYQLNQYIMTEKEFLNKLRKATLDVNESYKEIEAYRKEDKLPPVSFGFSQIMLLGKLWELSKQYFGI